MAAVTVDELRKRMREKFPQAHSLERGLESVAEEAGTLFDAGMFPAGAISEVVPAGRFSGIALMVAGLLENEGVPEVGWFSHGVGGRGGWV